MLGRFLQEMALARYQPCLIEVLEVDFVLADAGYDSKTSCAAAKLSLQNS